MHIILGILAILCSLGFVFGDWPADIKFWGLVVMICGILVLLGLN
jgi:hypothetical protein